MTVSGFSRRNVSIHFHCGERGCFRLGSLVVVGHCSLVHVPSVSSMNPAACAVDAEPRPKEEDTSKSKNDVRRLQAVGFLMTSAALRNVFLAVLNFLSPSSPQVFSHLPLRPFGGRLRHQRSAVNLVTLGSGDEASLLRCTPKYCLDSVAAS